MDRAQRPEVRADLIALLPALRVFARALLGGRDGADDLVQEALARALAAEARLPDGPDLRPYLFVVLRNAWRSGERRRARERRALAAQAIEQAGREGGAALLPLTDALAALPPLEREALVLLAAEGFTPAEAARVCGVAEGTVRARASRARARLRTLLEPAPRGARG